MFRNAKRFIAILLVLILAASTYAFAAANTIVASNAGYGSSTIVGYDVSNVKYNLDTAGGNESNLISISFGLNPTGIGAATPSVNLKPGLVKLATTALTTPAAFNTNICTVGGGDGAVATPWLVTCSFGATPISVASVVVLNIVAVTGTYP